MTQDQRKQKYVNPAVQGALVRRLVWHWVAFLAAGFVVHFLLMVLTDPFTEAKRHAQTVLRTQAPFLLVGFCLIPVFIMDAVKLSHRWTGPLVRIRHQIRAMAKGQAAQAVTLRPGDFWHDFAADFNAMLSRIDVRKDVGGTEGDRV